MISKEIPSWRIQTSRKEWKQIEAHWDGKEDTYFSGYWWQDETKVKQAQKMLKLEAKLTGGFDVFGEAVAHSEQNPSNNIYAIQALFNAERTGYGDENLLNQLEIVMTKNGKDIHEMKMKLDETDLDNGMKEYENILFKEQGKWLERNPYQRESMQCHWEYWHPLVLWNLPLPKRKWLQKRR